jgi:hypothetical protein
VRPRAQEPSYPPRRAGNAGEAFPTTTDADEAFPTSTDADEAFPTSTDAEEGFPVHAGGPWRRA